MNQTTYDIAIIGGGIVGLSIAYKLSKQQPSLKIAVLEKENELAFHQTGHNSGVIHAGIYYAPGSHRARLCRDGRAQLIDFAREHSIKHEICGKLIVATKDQEVEPLKRLLKRGAENGISGLQLLKAEELRELEPDCGGVAGIWVPETGLIDYREVSQTLANEFRQHASNAILSATELKRITKRDGVVRLDTTQGQITAKYLVACAGLQCDRVAKLDGLKLSARVVPFRGDYYQLTTGAQIKVRNMIYPVPNPDFPFLGVHFTRTIHNTIKCGPNAVLSFAREGYRKVAFDIRDSADSLSFGGVWRLFAKHWRYGLGEYRRALSKQLFVESAQLLVPKVRAEDLVPGKPGIRANLVSRDGKVVDDFMFEETPHSIHVLNTPSPAATACLAIGDVVVSRASELFSV